jgi:hypothetical protein
LTILLQHPLDTADSLPCALFVFHQAEPYAAVAVVAEAFAEFTAVCSKLKPFP